MNLVEWTSAFIDYMNSFKADLKRKKAEEGNIICEYEGKGTIRYIISESLDEKIFENLQGKTILVTLNSKHNLNFVIDNWEKFAGNDSLKIIFANPSVNMQWSVLPHLHHKFADPESLKTGLKSLFNSIPSV